MSSTATALESDLDFLDDLIDRMPETPPPSDILQWVCDHRVMPGDGPRPGPFSLAGFEYLREVYEEMGPYSNVQCDAICKAAQTAVSTAAEGVIAFHIGASPSSILYCSATDANLLEWSRTRLDPLLDSCGLRGLIAPTSGNVKAKRTGDTLLLKEFPGGSLGLASARSASRLRSASRKILIQDEIDSAPEILAKEGSWLDVSEARTLSYGPRRRILKISTPTVFSGPIWQAFLLGDQRRYMVPCPYCGQYQELEVGAEDAHFGLKGETKAGELLDVYYMCRFCGDAIRASHKSAMVAAGRWEPHSQTSRPGYRSRLIPGLISPFLSWRKLYEDLRDAQGNPEKLRTVVNLEVGLPWEETGTRPKLETVINLRGGRPLRIVGQEGLWLCGAIDVQRGSETNVKLPPRLEGTVLSFGRDFRVGVVDVFKFEGAIDDAYSGAWELLYEHILSGGFTFKRTDGVEMTTALVLIDSGDGVMNQPIFNFVSRIAGSKAGTRFQACKGFGFLLNDGKSKPIPGSQTVRQRYQKYKIGSTRNGENLVEVSGNFYKSLIYNSLRIPRQPTEPQLPGFIDFPADVDEEYFASLLSEEKLKDGSFKKIRTRNEMLDVFTYSMCAGDIVAQEWLAALRDSWRAQGRAEIVVMRDLGMKQIFDLLENNLARFAMQQKWRS